MAYQLNTTNGALLVNLADGQIDTSTTDITLIGRNYTGFGESINENFIKLLENFANNSAPDNPIAGQLWWDTSENRLKVYTGTDFTTGGGPILSSTRPEMVAGDLWINNETNQISFYDGTDLVNIGPLYNAFQGVSGPVVDTVLDSQSTSRTIVKYYVGNTLVGLWSKVAFTPLDVTQIPGFTGSIEKGFNTVESDFRFNGTATSSLTLIDAEGVERSAAQFLPTDRDGQTVGRIRVANNGGLIVGLSENNIMKVVGNSFVTENQLTDDDYKIRVRTSSGPIDALVVDTSLQNMGIFESNPQYSIDVGGDARIQGNLIVTGDTFSTEVETVRIKDKNIELGITDDSTLIDDATADGGGIILSSSAGTKDWLWNQTTNSWTSNVNINLVGKSLKIDGITILQGTGAPGLTSIGTLTNLDVDNVNIDGYRITTSGGGLQIASDGDINITNNQKITGVADPTSDQDVATKAYVDSAINTEALSLAMDITGLTNAQIALVINDIAPANTKQNGSQARVHCTDTVGASATLEAANLVSALQKSFVAVQELDSGGNDAGSTSVLQDVTFVDVTGSVTLTVNRTLKLFEVQNGQWAYVQDLTSSV